MPLPGIYAKREGMMRAADEHRARAKALIMRIADFLRVQRAIKGVSADRHPRVRRILDLPRSF